MLLNILTRANAPKVTSSLTLYSPATYNFTGSKVEKLFVLLSGEKASCILLYKVENRPLTFVVVGRVLAGSLRSIPLYKKWPFSVKALTSFVQEMNPKSIRLTDNSN